MKYRAEIDGLRALAVVPVILFHAGFDLFSGGFVGVDIFFVISGFLITTILIGEIEGNNFSIINFYDRRARRILPALFFIMLLSIPFAWMWMLPNQMKDFSKSLISVSLFVSNIMFWRESGYFEAAAEEKPLLHTWSLAVEEQYYVLFPLFLLLAWRFGKDKVFWMIVLFAAISLMLSEWGWRNLAIANFYLAPTRAWELFAGSLAAFLVQRNGVQKNDALSLIGLASIIFSIFVYDKNTPFPSVYALAPVLGVVLLILYADKDTFTAKLLSFKPLVGIGLISYSAYLWHQPLFAFARIRLSEKPSDSIMLILSAASIALAYITWKYVETPCRTKNLIGTKIIYVSFCLCTAFFVAFGLAGHQNDGFRKRVDVPDTVYTSLERSERQSECFGSAIANRSKDWYCTIGLPMQSVDYMVFGDSHALSILPAIDEALINVSKGGYFVGVSGCLPFLGVYALRTQPMEDGCHNLNSKVYDFVARSNISKIFLVARWTYYTDGGYNGDDFSYIALEKNASRTKDVSRQAFKAGLHKTLEEYKKIGVDIVIVSQIPQQKQTPIRLYSESVHLGKKLEDISIKVSEHQALQTYVNNVFKESDVEVIDFTSVLCGSESCVVGTPEESFYYDDDHLSLKGSKKLVSAIVDYLEQ